VDLSRSPGAATWGSIGAKEPETTASPPIDTDRPVGTAKSVWFTEEGLKRAEELFYTLFAAKGPEAPG